MYSSSGKLCFSFSSVTLSDIDTAVANLVDSAPETLNTLNELAAALGDDPNYATTTTNAIGLRAKIANTTVYDGSMTASIIPSANDTFDIGSADYKIRDLYVADSSIWIGDEHKLSTASGTMKIMKRKKNAVPGAITAAGGNAAGALAHSGRGSLSDLKIQEWLAYAKSISGTFTKMTDVFRPTEDNDWEETDKPATDLTGASLRIDASTNSPTTGEVLSLIHL